MKIFILAFLFFIQSPFTGKIAFEIQTKASIAECLQKTNGTRPVPKNLVFKSTDGGQSWHDLSEGLPENFKEEGFFTNEHGLFLRDGNGIYHHNPESKAPYWEKEILFDERRKINSGDSSLSANGYEGQFQKINGARAWSPLYSNFQGQAVRTLFETAGGSVFVASDLGLYKSVKGGKSWKQVHNGGWVMKCVESDGVLLATSQGGILRSTDDGETWTLVISEGGVGIHVERIRGGFAAITFNTESQTRRVRASYDGGISWKPIDAGLPPSLLISSIVQAGENFFCGHPDGIFRSSDQGKTWKLILPSVDNKVYNLTVSGKVIYAIPRDGGC